jgi:hypothetical protein
MDFTDGSTEKRQSHRQAREGRYTALPKDTPALAPGASVGTMWRAVPGRKSKFTDSFSNKPKLKINVLKVLLNFLHYDSIKLRGSLPIGSSSKNQPRIYPAGTMSLIHANFSFPFRENSRNSRQKNCQLLLKG